MGRELGRISGPLLSDNLKRNGNNLAVETQLLYFDVVNNRIGINTSAPTRDLLINNNTNTTNLLVTTRADLGPNFEISTSQIQNFVNVINIVPDQTTNPVINIQNVLATDNLNFRDNAVSANTSNTDVNISPSYTPQIGYRLVLQQDAAGNKSLPFYAGSGNQYVTFSQLLTASDMTIDETWLNNSATVIFNDGSVFPLSNAGISGIYGYVIIPLINNVLSKTINNIWPLTILSVDYAPELDARIVSNANMLVSGNLHATGNITWEGNITLGNASTDTINFAAEIDSDILPSANQVDDLGSSSLRWKTLYTNNLNITTGQLPTVTAGIMTAGGVSVYQNSIFNSVASNNISLLPSGTGHVNLLNSTTSLTGSNITNGSNDVLTFSSTDNGYNKFAGTNGTVIPAGNDANRPVAPEQGTTRYNSDTGHPEVYDNSVGWIPLRGTAPVITNSDVNDITGIWALVLGL
jgi:hypothetical protein